jgi:Protein of unknown function (DUF2568)
MTAINDGIRFLLEIGALVAVGWWGWQTGSNLVTRLALSVGGIVLIAVVWATFRADDGANVEVSTPVRIVIEVAVFAAATAALYSLGKTRWAIAYAVVAAVNEVLNYTLQ